MGASDAAASEGVMVAFLPTTSEWCRQDLPHMTLVYAGKTSQLPPSDFNSLAKDAATIALLTRPFVLSVSGTDIFGDEEKVNVLRFRLTPELMAARRIVQKWNASKHPFSPHATIGPAWNSNDIVPSHVGFDKLLVAWGEEQITFKL